MINRFENLFRKFLSVEVKLKKYFEVEFLKKNFEEKKSYKEKKYDVVKLYSNTLKETVSKDVEFKISDLFIFKE
jgi:hypothetical protein